MPAKHTEAVHYRAKSMFVSRTEWFNALSGVGALLAMPELVQIFGPGSPKYIVFAVAAVNMALRVISVRPVAAIRPGKTKTVAVPKL